MNRRLNSRASDAVRASDADREQIVDRLHKAATEGRIASDELEQRVSTALKARTYGELEETVADLPGVSTRRQPAAPRSTGAWALSVVRANPVLLLFALPAIAVVSAMLLAATIVWMVMIVVVMVLGGRPHGMRAPWMYTRHHRPRPHGRRSGSFSYWA